MFNAEFDAVRYFARFYFMWSEQMVSKQASDKIVSKYGLKQWS